MEPVLNTIPEAIEAIKNGEVIIVVDDEDRENEGDFICAAELITPEIINFMATHGRGLICAPIEEKRADKLGLEMMVSDNTALHETAFTISIDLLGHGCTTGISAHDRAATVRALTWEHANAEDFARPGHIFPLRAKEGGVIRRSGHTEAAIDLAKLAGFKPVGVLVEILKKDGSMARLPELLEMAKKFDLKIISIKELISYRLIHDSLVEEVYHSKIEHALGEFEIRAFRQITNGDIHIAITKGEWQEDEPVLVKVHSASETGGVLGFLFNDYYEDLNSSLRRISEEGKGLLLYIRHSEKKSAILQSLYELTHRGEYTEKIEQRDYGVGAQILRELGVRKLRLMTRNPKKRIGLDSHGLEIVENVGV